MDFKEAVQVLKDVGIKPINDSGKRRYTLESGVEGMVTMGGYCVSVSDPVTGRFIGKIHPISFIEMMIKDYSD